MDGPARMAIARRSRAGSPTAKRIGSPQRSCRRARSSTRTGRSTCTRPKTVYSDRWYDAIGVFGHLSDITGASIVWPRLAPVAVVSQNGNDANTLSSLIEGVSTSYYSTWGASYFQQTNYRWKITGPGQPPSSGPAPDDATINPGTDTMISAPPYQATLTNVSGESDILVVALLTGYGRVHDQGWGSTRRSTRPGRSRCASATPAASATTTAKAT